MYILAVTVEGRAAAVDTKYRARGTAFRVKVTLNSCFTTDIQAGIAVDAAQRANDIFTFLSDSFDTDIRDSLFFYEQNL